MQSELISVPSDGAHLAVHVAGHGPLVLLVPSLGRGAADFDALATALVAAGFRTAAVDPRGVAQSAGATERLTLHHYAADLAAVIRQLDGAPAHVVGHAFGNRVVRCLATGHPDLVRSVTLVGAGGRVPRDPEVAQAFRDCFNLTLPPEHRLQAIATAFFAPGNDAAAWLDGWWPCASSAEMQASNATPVDEWWDAGSAPVLVIQGLQDRIAPPANGRLLAEEHRDRVTLVELERAGHAMLPECPGEIAQELTGFLQRLSA